MLSHPAGLSVSSLGGVVASEGKSPQRLLLPLLRRLLSHAVVGAR